MKVSIKAQIIANILTALQALVDAGTVRQVSRGKKLAINLAIRPSIQLYVGEERPTSKDNRGRTYHFDMCAKLLIDDPKDVGAASDTIVPEIQRLIESNVQVSQLAVIVDGGEELPFVSESNEPLGGSLVMYTIQYRRLLGDPYTTY